MLFGRFSRTPTCDGQTDRHRAIASRRKNERVYFWLQSHRSNIRVLLWTMLYVWRPLGWHKCKRISLAWFAFRRTGDGGVLANLLLISDNRAVHQAFRYGNNGVYTIERLQSIDDLWAMRCVSLSGHMTDANAVSASATKSIVMRWTRPSLFLPPSCATQSVSKATWSARPGLRPARPPDRPGHRFSPRRRRPPRKARTVAIVPLRPGPAPTQPATNVRLCANYIEGRCGNR